MRCGAPGSAELQAENIPADRRRSPFKRVFDPCSILRNTSFGPHIYPFNLCRSPGFVVPNPLYGDHMVFAFSPCCAIL